MTKNEVQEGTLIENWAADDEDQKSAPAIAQPLTCINEVARKLSLFPRSIPREIWNRG